MKQINYYQSNIPGIEIKTCSNSLHSYKDHVHQELSIGYIEKGSTTLNINGENFHLSENEAIIIYPFVTHRCQPDDLENWQFTMIYISNEFFKGLNLNNQQNAIGIKKIGKMEAQHVKTLIEVLSGNESLFEKENALINTINNIFDSCEEELAFAKDIRINKVYEYIKDNFLEELSLGHLESYLKINKFYLIKEFKLKYNTTPGAYQLQLKVDYGKQLLKQGDDLVNTALEAGFYDQAHFSKEFKKAYGITPSSYLRSLRS